ncbi:MAG: hypothetical protein KI788_03950 [Mameliella sp.]|nr:hypothetical protein [Mameliella sp.]
MAWSYCRNCDRPLDMPTAGQAVVGRRECPDCGEIEGIDDLHRESLIDDLNNRLTELEEKI